MRLPWRKGSTEAEAGDEKPPGTGNGTHNGLYDLTLNALRDRAPEKIRDALGPAREEPLSETDLRLLAAGKLPASWYDEAARLSGPPSLLVDGMEAPVPGVTFGTGSDPEQQRAAYELQVAWLLGQPLPSGNRDAPTEAGS